VKKKLWFAVFSTYQLFSHKIKIQQKHTKKVLSSFYFSSGEKGIFVMKQGKGGGGECKNLG